MKLNFFLLLMVVVISQEIAKAQSEIHQFKANEKKSEIIGKCENNIILLKVKNNYQSVGKYSDSLIYENCKAKNKWEVVGRLDDSLIYKKHPIKKNWVCIGKYNDGIIYKKSQKETWKKIGKYSDCPAAGAYLLLFYKKQINEDAGSFVI